MKKGTVRIETKKVMVYVCMTQVTERAYSENCLTPNDKMSSRNVATKTHKLFRCDRRSTNCKKLGGGVMLFVPLKLAPSERDDLKFLDNSTFESLWVECRSKFTKNCKSK